MSNNFPRVFSISTIGIKQHFNADYLLHKHRTDFSGESGSGKSMISDMIQLILIGAGDYESSTDANKPREIKGMVLIDKGKSFGRGYVFLNIEVSHKQFIVIGAYIESTSNQAEMFIIQNGFDWENLTPLNQPFFHNNLIIDNKIEPIKRIVDKIQNVNFKAFNRKKYHQILFDNEILSLDLTKKDTRKSYASIFRSFSRGKGFRIDSENLKNFLFGSDEQNFIKQKYDEEVNNINNDFYEHKKYLEEIELINKKQKFLVDVLNKHKDYVSLSKEYAHKKINYWENIRTDAVEKSKELELDYKICQVENLELKKVIKSTELNDLNELKTKKHTLKHKDIGSLLKEKELTEKNYLNLVKQKETIEEVKVWLNQNNNDLESMKTWFAKQVLKYNNRKDLDKFIEYLNNEKIKNSFEKSEWYIDYENANENFENQINSLNDEINKLTILSKFSDYTEKDSLSSWAFDNLKFPVTRINESILIYFQKYSKSKPKNIKEENRYLPFPEELFENLDIKNRSDDGFWLNLDGVYEYIEYTQEQLLNIEDSNEIKSILKEKKETINQKVKKLQNQKNEKEKLKNILFAYGNIEAAVSLYTLRTVILGYDLTEISKFSNINLDEYLTLYNNKEKLLNNYKTVDVAYKKVLKESISTEEIDTRIKELEKYFFDSQDISDDEIEIKIEGIKIEIRKKDSDIENILKSNVLDKKKIFEKSVVDFENSSLTVLLKELNTSDKKLSDLKDQSNNYTNKVSISLQEIKEAKTNYFEHFNKKIEVKKMEVSQNPDEGNNSLKNRVFRAKTLFETKYDSVKDGIDNSSFEETYSIGILAHKLLPTVFKTSKIDEDLILINISERLNKLTNDIQVIGSRKVEILKKVFNDVNKVYNDYLTRLVSIQSFLKDRVITGGNKATLSWTKSIDYPINWITPFRKHLDDQLSNTGLFKELKKEIDINKMMIKAFQESGGSSKVEPKDLINPKSYFDLEFDLKLENGDVNSGSNGQTYTANALLGLARLSLIEDHKRKGIKMMPIDEAEGLGGNYDMLHSLAKDESYQIITMGIETTGEILEGEQYLYIMNENKISSLDSYVPPLGIFSGDDVVEDINNYVSLMSYE